MKKWENYIDEVLGFVKFKYDHKTIRQELAEHMEDLKEELMAEGLDEDIAEEMTVVYMGEAQEIGEALNQEHSPLLGWIWCITRVVAVLLALVVLSDMGNFLFGALDNSLERYEHPEDAGLVWEIPIDRAYRVNDDTLILEDVYYYDDETLAIVYRTKKNPFARSMNWSKSVRGIVLDEKGEELGLNGGGSKQGGYNGIGEYRCKEVPEDAKTLMVTGFGELRIYIDLETGEVTENET